MMAAQKLETHLLNSPSFAAFSDRLRENVDLSKTNWFRVGGRAQFLFKPNDVQDLSTFLALLPDDMPVTVLGVGSNLIVRDGGIDGVVIKLGRVFAQMEAQDSIIIAGAAALDCAACDKGSAGPAGATVRLSVVSIA